MMSNPFKIFFESDRFKYQRALAVQKMKNDPDAIFIDITCRISRYRFEQTAFD